MKEALAAGTRNTVALDLKTTLLRRTGQTAEAAALADRVLALDPLDFRAAYERYLATVNTAGVPAGPSTRDVARMRKTLTALQGSGVQSFLELAHDYGHGGFLDEAIDVLDLASQDGLSHPMLAYTRGYFCQKAGRAAEAARAFQQGRTASPTGCFPFRRESIQVLRQALQSDPTDARALYYLGNLLYEKRPREAMAAWEQSIALDPGLATAHRNLGLARAQVDHDGKGAMASLDRAVACDPEDPRLLFERDLFYEAGRVPADTRLQALMAHQPVVLRHNDTLAREIQLLTLLGRYDEAIAPLLTRRFRKWEGIGNIHTTYVDAHLLRGRKRLEAGQPEPALADFEAALLYPENLEVARPAHGGREGQCWYFCALAHEATGRPEKAGTFFEKCAAVTAGGSGSVLRYYQALALKKQGRDREAGPLLEGLIAFAEKRLAALDQGEAVDFFAKFGQTQPVTTKQAHAHFLEGLGHLGHGRREPARVAFQRALDLDPDHLWARAEHDRLAPAK